MLSGPRSPCAAGWELWAQHLATTMWTAYFTGSAIWNSVWLVLGELFSLKGEESFSSPSPFPSPSASPSPSPPQTNHPVSSFCIPATTVLHPCLPLAQPHPHFLDVCAAFFSLVPEFETTPPLTPHSCPQAPALLGMVFLPCKCDPVKPRPRCRCADSTHQPVYDTTSVYANISATP